jgi:hypothetical protein
MSMRWTEEQLAEHLSQRFPKAATTNKSKYRNVRCESADGKSFDSKLECRYYEQLLMRWEAGHVFWFVRQVNFELEGGVVFRADFVVVTAAGVEVVDTTGVLTQTKANKIKQMKARYGIDVKLVRKV